MATAVGSVASQVGLQILLQPFSHTIGNIICTGVGVIYPSYESFKAVEILRLENNTAPAIKWLTYWAVFGSLSGIEMAISKLLPWIPYYPVVKLAFLIWLQHPRYFGAGRLSMEFARPFLHRTHHHIDEIINALKQNFKRPELIYVFENLNNMLAHIPVLEWFVRGPDGRRVSRGDGRGRPPGFVSGGRSNFITR